MADCAMQAALDGFFKRHLPFYRQEKIVAVGVSGGPDSMALVHALAACSVRQGGPAILALTVDHGLRPESAEEARQVGVWLSGVSGVSHRILSWPGEKPCSSVQEEARSARYALMSGECRRAGAGYLCLAHHQDDQAETLLMRLAAGSGLDGLAGMAPSQEKEEGLILLRPFLEMPKAALVAYCREAGISYVEDPSNDLEKYARARLRKSAAILAREGLSAKRLSTTARRLARGRQALEALAQSTYEECLLHKDRDRIVFICSRLRACYEENIFRVFQKALLDLGQAGDYGPRTERVEAIIEDFLSDAPFRKRTLGGVVISVHEKRGELVFDREKPKKP